MRNETIKKYNVIFEINTRLSDIDVNRNVNNFFYNSYFDTALNNFLITNKIIDFNKGKILDLVVESKCNYHQPASFPDHLKIGFSVKKIGNTSVTYILGAFKENKIVASGHIVHVYVDRATYRPKKLSRKFRKILESIKIK